VPKEEIEFIIQPDGTVTERTIGLKGAACEQVTARVEQALGEILDRQSTTERYEESPAEQDQQTLDGA